MDEVAQRKREMEEKLQQVSLRCGIYGQGIVDSTA